jgi:hypothetical protein
VFKFGRIAVVPRRWLAVVHGSSALLGSNASPAGPSAARSAQMDEPIEFVLSSLI